jgi:hypothetical protein
LKPDSNLNRNGCGRLSSNQPSGCPQEEGGACLDRSSGAGAVILILDMPSAILNNHGSLAAPEWRNWQTRGIQNPVLATG